MKKIIYLIALFGFLTVQAQREKEVENETPLTPGGLMEDIYDKDGNQYKLSDLVIKPRILSKTGQVTTNTLLCSPGMFDLYFETNSGMEIVGNATHDARRAVVCQVFQDLSNFISHPASTRIRIWVRNINANGTVPNGVLGSATAFYNLPVGDSNFSNPTPQFGGIVDNEIWKTIHTGADSYTNLILPLESNNTTPTNVFYHGMMSFNFAMTWNTDLSIDAPAGTHDLYSVVLHEVTHALGFSSLINYHGHSRMRLYHYTRYDRFLRNNAGTAPLITGSSPITMYNYAFNSALSPVILRPNCLLNPPTTTNSSGWADCNATLRYVSGTRNIPIYTPFCYEPGSSLSHYEDMLYPSCASPHGDNAYFVMSEANPSGVTKRYLQPEERLALCDLGYNVNTSYGSSSTFHGTKTYTGGVCGGIAVAGINDGISGGAIVYTGNINSPITINGPSAPVGILSNDVTTNAADLRFEGLEDVYYPSPATSFSATSGSASTPVTFSSIYPGIHLLRYVPFNNATQQRGNITYIYVRVLGNCASAPTCNLVRNGNFEQYSSPPASTSQLIRACGWDNATYKASADYFNTDGSAAVGFCNTFGYQADKVSGNKGYAGMYIDPGRGDVNNSENIYSEPIRTELPVPLSPNTNYQLTFDVSMADNYTKVAARLQAYLSPTEFQLSTSGIIPSNLINPTFLFTNGSYIVNSAGWEQVTFTFNTGSATDLRFLYIGGLNNVQTTATSNSPVPVSGCTFNPNTEAAYYYIDNVRLISLANESLLSLPASICDNQIIPNLNNHLSIIQPGGVFSGPGITLSAGKYSFNPTTLTPGNYTITYTYTNSSNCIIPVSANIIVSDCSATSCPGNLVFSANQIISPATYQAANTIINNNSYMVSPGMTVTQIAGNSITFSPNTDVRSGCDFTARIAACTQTSPRMAGGNGDESVADFDSKEMLRLFPNPTSGMLNVENEGAKMKKITIFSMEQKLIFNQTFELTNQYQLDISGYQKGLYILTVETEKGEHISRKLMKN